MTGARVPLEVTSRSGRHLRSTAAVLLIAVVAACSVLLHLQARQAQIREDFQDNPRLHVLEVPLRLSDGRLTSLTFEDRSEVSQLLDDAGVRAGQVLQRLELSGGLTDRTDRIITLVGLDGDRRTAGDLLGTGTLGADTAYAVAGSALASPIVVPVSRPVEGGMVSDRTEEVPVTAAADLDRDRVALVIGGRVDEVVIVDGPTFERFASVMFEAPWAEVRQRWQAGELPLVSLVSGLLVEIEDLGQVRTAAGVLEAEGYEVTYALRAFDDLDASLRSEARLALAVTGLLLGASVAYVLLSWNAYFRLSHRDMGILRHLGWQPTEIERAYARPVWRLCLLLLGALWTVLLLGSVVVIGTGAMPWAIAASAMGSAAVVALGGAVTRGLLPRHTRRGVLELLRVDRQFQ